MRRARRSIAALLIAAEAAIEEAAGADDTIVHRKIVTRVPRGNLVNRAGSVIVQNFKEMPPWAESVSRSDKRK
jgi:hypothetical protein